MANSFLDFLESMTIAMEADDITGQTANEVRSAIGGAPSTTMNSNNEDEEDLEKVDDIFGLQEVNDDPSGNPEQDKAEGAEELPPNEENEEEDGAEGDPNVSEEEDPMNGEQKDSSVNEDLVFTKKNRVRDNLVQLYTIISGEIEIIVNSLTNVNDQQTIDVINRVINHLRNCKSYLYKTLTQNITTLEYDELLQRYITLKRVYDICIEMMEKHFKKDKENK